MKQSVDAALRLSRGTLGAARREVVRNWNHSTEAAVSSMASTGTAGPIQQAIERKIGESLRPTAFEIVNDSSKHAGHAGNPSGAPDAETHFNLVIESSAFEGKSRVQQHRMVYELLGEEFAQGLHALALKTSPPKK
jgi:stress-induced morphogen